MSSLILILLLVRKPAQPPHFFLKRMVAILYRTLFCTEGVHCDANCISAGDTAAGTHKYPLTLKAETAGIFCKYIIALYFVGTAPFGCAARKPQLSFIYPL